MTIPDSNSSNEKREKTLAKYRRYWNKHRERLLAEARERYKQKPRVKALSRAAVQRFREKNPERNKEINRLSRYKLKAERRGITVAQYIDQLQNPLPRIRKANKRCPLIVAVAKRTPEQQAAIARERARSYYYRNYEKSLLRKRDYRHLQRQINPDKQNRQAVTLKPKQWAEIKALCDNRCVYCGVQERLTQDHFEPLSRGGKHTPSNIVPACVSCNASKSNKAYVVWLATKQKVLPRNIGVGGLRSTAINF